MLTCDIRHPWVLGSFAVYAPNVQVARQVYALLCVHHPDEPFGVITTESGDEIDWVNMRHEPRY
jgi:hypothetical protein